MSDVLAVLRRRWLAGSWLASAAAGPAWEPFAVPLRGPTATQLAGQFDEVRDWVSRWRTAEKRGLRLEFHSVGGRRVGTNQLPRRVWFDEPEQAFRLLSVQDQVDRFVELVGLERARAPRLVDWMLATHTACWQQLPSGICWCAPCCGSTRTRSSRALSTAPACTCGRSTCPAWIPSSSKRTVDSSAACLEEQLDPTRVNQAAPRSEFAARYGFRSKPEYVRFRFLDARSVPGCIL